MDVWSIQLRVNIMPKKKYINKEFREATKFNCLFVWKRDIRQISNKQTNNLKSFIQQFKRLLIIRLLTISPRNRQPRKFPLR